MATIFLFSSSLSGCSRVAREAGETVTREVGERVTREAGETVARNVNPPVKQWLSEAEIAAKLNIDLLAAKAAQSNYPLIHDEAQQRYIAMVQNSGTESFAQAQDAVQQAADNQNIAISGGTVLALAGGVVVNYAMNQQQSYSQ
ncbi:MAG: hypothetical protein HEQ26_12480 [Dolichospermum sp. DL01]|nr:MAG: hypothetical protein HEQ26_12480 [Dolichospermum sp. DL01]